LSCVDIPSAIAVVRRIGQHGSTEVRLNRPDNNTGHV
jgi:hypothetical protein